MSSIVESTPWMLPFQYLRSLLWVALAVLVIRMMKGSWWQVALAVSLLFTVPAIYLLLPNPMMPDAVRMAHLAQPHDARRCSHGSSGRDRAVSVPVRVVRGVAVQPARSR